VPACGASLQFMIKVFSERGAGQGSDRLRRMRQGDLAVLGLAMPAGCSSRLSCWGARRLGTIYGARLRCCASDAACGRNRHGRRRSQGTAPPQHGRLAADAGADCARIGQPHDGGCQQLMIERLQAIGLRRKSIAIRTGGQFLGQARRGGPVFASPDIPCGADGAARRMAWRSLRAGHQGRPSTHGAVRRHEERPRGHGTALRRIRRPLPRASRHDCLLDHQR